MKRRDLIKALEKLGAKFLREGSNHTVYVKSNGERLEVPRHKEIPEPEAKRIIKKAGEQ